MLQVQWFKYILEFRFKAGTSRGILTDKTSYLIRIRDKEGTQGIGECSILKGLSIDDRPDFENTLNATSRKVSNRQAPTIGDLSDYIENLVGNEWPSIRMGFETAWLDYLHGGKMVIFDNDFINGKPIPINGLIWMGEMDFMRDQIDKKLTEDYKCIKIKVGALDFNSELELIKYIREKDPEIKIRLDANGAFSPKTALKNLEKLSGSKIHSIEQPVKPGQRKVLMELCKESPIPVALDEELIGLNSNEKREDLLAGIKPAYIVLKPSLIGGFTPTADWIELAGKYKTGWWITSALESNIGLNAISQFTANYPVSMEQGLGTGQLYTNNIPSPLQVKDGSIIYSGKEKWDLSILS